MKSDRSNDRRQSRAERIAELETNSFLAELKQEIEVEQVHSSLEQRSQFPSLSGLLADFHIPLEQVSSNSPSNKSHASGNLHSSHSSSGSRGEDSEDVHMMDSVADDSSPETLPATTTIEPYVTSKVMRLPEFSEHTLELFKTRPNVWVRNSSRPTALDMWTKQNGGVQDSDTCMGETSDEKIETLLTFAEL